MPFQLLEGVKIVEWGSLVAAPFAGKMLADMGADVVKVEPLQGDEARARGPFAQGEPGPDRSLLFAYLNTNKQGVTLDPDMATGRDLFRDLLRQAHLLVADECAATLEAWGLDYDNLKVVNPSLVVTTLTPFGWTGPYRDFKAHYLNAYHAGGDGYMLPGGQIAISLYKGREPLKAGGYIGEYQAGISAAAASLSAVLQSLNTDQGSHVDVSKQEALMHLNSSDLALWPNEGRVWSRRNRVPPYLGGLLRCKDGFWQTNIHQDHQWQGIVDFMGSPEWALKKEYETRPGRLELREELEPQLEAWAQQHDKDELYEELQARRVACGPVYSVDEVTRDPQEVGRDFFHEVDLPGIGAVKMPSAPWKLSPGEWGLRLPPPRLGEHNEAVFCGRLGLPKEHLSKLRQVGVI